MGPPRAALLGTTVTALFLCAAGSPMTAAGAQGVFVRTCSDATSVGWSWDGAGGVIRHGRGGGGCLVAPTPFASHLQLTFVTPCPADKLGEAPCPARGGGAESGNSLSTNTPTTTTIKATAANGTRPYPWCWNALHAPFGDTFVVAGADASAEWGPAALLGQAVVGHAVMLYAFSSVEG
jgi:hypothetical protein